MKKITLLLFLLSMLSCKKNDSFLPIPSFGNLLATIDYDNGNRSWAEDYFYDFEDRLIRVDDLRSLGRRYELVYEQERLAEVKTYQISDDRFIFRDELFYDEQGRLAKTLNYSANFGEELPLAYTHEYTYNEDGAIIQKTATFSRDTSFIQIEKYFWKNGNIIKVEHYENKENNLSYVFEYEYDQAVNFNRYQTHQVNHFPVWNQNNITQATLTKDCTGLIDLSCNPCISYFRYDEANFPVEVDSPSRTFKLTYK